MNRYSTAILLTGLLIILTSNLAIAKNTIVNIPSVCINPNNQVSSVVDEVNAAGRPRVQRRSTDPKQDGRDPTQASFWWAAEQFDPFNGKLVENWLALPEKKQVNLVVSWRLWTLLDYLGRYRFVNQFGTVARKYGYSLAIFNQEAQCLASYQYNPDSNPPKWELNLEKLGQDSLLVEPQEVENIPLLEESSL